MKPRATPPRRLGLLPTGGRTASTPQRDPFPFAIGDRIAGDLTVIGHLAQGRLCDVYQVWSAGQWCAFTCKILSPERRDRRTDWLALRREGRILSKVRHPNLVVRYGEGEHEGLPYLLLEYLEGPSLFDLLETQPRRRLAPCDAVRAATHIGAALYHLHRHGFLHLDLKPANLILRDGMPVLIDLDSARRLQPGLVGNRLGTGPYMAPEQVLRDPLGAPADIYGLGAVLYELLTGRWPFEAVYQEEEPRQGIERQYPQVGTSPPPPPREFEPEITVPLERTVMRCLAADAADRFPSMHPLLLALAEQLRGTESLWPTGVTAERRRAPRDG